MSRTRRRRAGSRRARAVSAVAFGAAAVVAAWGFLAALVVYEGGGAAPWWAFLAAPVLYAAPAALAGALAGPRLAAVRTAWGVVPVGVGVTLATALLLLAVASVAPVGGGRTAGGAAGGLGWLVLDVAAASVVLSPLGVAAAWAAWRRLRPAAQAS